MLLVSLRVEVPLSEPSARFGLVTWFDASIRTSDEHASGTVGSARVAWIRVADAMNRGVPIHAVLDGAGGELPSLYEVFFDPATNCLQEQFHNGVGWDVLFVADVQVAEAWRGRHIEEALMMRMVHTWAETCAIVVIPVTGATDSARWRGLSFEIVREPTGGRPGYAVLDRTVKHPRVHAFDAEGHRFAIAPAT
jgi:hypothetical protein